MKSSFWTWHVALEEVSRDILALEWRNSQSPRTLPHGIAPQERFRGVPLKKFAQNPKCPSVPQDLQECPVLKSILQSHKSAGCPTRARASNKGCLTPGENRMHPVAQGPGSVEESACLSAHCVQRFGLQIAAGRFTSVCVCE